MQFNSWAVYNWVNSSSMTHKEFILKASLGVLQEVDPGHMDVWSPATTTPDSPDMSPAAVETPPGPRFV